MPGHSQRIFLKSINFVLRSFLQGLDCCSDNAVSFHYVSPNQMYVLDYLVYHLRPYGIISHSQPLPDKIPFAQVVGSDKAAISMSNDIDDEAS